MAATGQFVKRMLQFARDWTGLAASNGAEVDLSQPNYFCRRAAHEHLVRNVELVAGNGLFDDGISHIARNRDQTVARYSFENRGLWNGVNDPVAHHENILTRALRNVTVGIEHNGLIKPKPLRLCFRQDRA